MANSDQRELLAQGAKEWNAWRKRNPSTQIDLNHALLRWMNLDGIDLSGAVLDGANLSHSSFRGADLRGASLRQVRMSDADLTEGHLEKAILIDADFYNVTLVKANLSFAVLHHAGFITSNFRGAILNSADLAGARLDHADLTAADLTNADLTGANLSSANLQHAMLRTAKADDVRLWETQRAGWDIAGVLCHRASWDEQGRVFTDYAAGEFEKLYGSKGIVELFYKDGLSTFELDTLPAILHQLSSANPGSEIRLKSIDEVGGGAKIRLSLESLDSQNLDKMKSELESAFSSQMALRDRELERLQIQKEYIESRYDKVVDALLRSSGQKTYIVQHSSNVVLGENANITQSSGFDPAELRKLLLEIQSRKDELHLGEGDSASLDAEVRAAGEQLEKAHPDRSVLARSLAVLQTFAKEAALKAAGKVGENLVSDWSSWSAQAHHLMQYLH